MISTSVMAAMAAVSAITILGPVTLLIIWSVKKKVNAMPALAGAFIFLVFARLLELIPHSFFILSDNPASRFLSSNPLAFALYGGLMAGIFEETGRFIVFRFFLKKYYGQETAITYGIGHGGFEAMSIVGFGFLQYLTIAQMINSGTMDTMMAAASGDALTSMEATVTAISSITVTTCIFSIIERIYAFIFHIAASVLVYHAVMVPQKKWLFPLAILLHTLLDVFAGLYQAGVLPLLAAELLGVAYTAGVAVFAYRLYKKKKEEDQNEQYA